MIIYNNKPSILQKRKIANIAKYLRKKNITITHVNIFGKDMYIRRVKNKGIELDSTDSAFLVYQILKKKYKIFNTGSGIKIY